MIASQISLKGDDTMRNKKVVSLTVNMKKLIPLISFLCLFVWYVGNLNTYKFHHEWCYWVSRMNPDNKYWTDSRRELTNMGMIPCKKCRP